MDLRIKDLVDDHEGLNSVEVGVLKGLEEVFVGDACTDRGCSKKNQNPFLLFFHLRVVKVTIIYITVYLLNSY